MRRFLSRLFRPFGRRREPDRPIVVFPPVATIHPVGPPAPPPNHVNVQARRRRLDEETRRLQEALTTETAVRTLRDREDG